MYIRHYITARKAEKYKTWGNTADCKPVTPFLQKFFPGGDTGSQLVLAPLLAGCRLNLGQLPGLPCRHH